jgi:hypothetical protein
MNTDTKIENRKVPSNKGKFDGQKLPLILKEIYSRLGVKSRLLFPNS